MADLTITTAQLLANDVGTGIIVTAVSQPTGGGSLVFDGETIKYTAGKSNTTDSFTYTIKDGANQTSTANVSITVTRKLSTRANDDAFDYPQDYIETT